MLSRAASSAKRAEMMLKLLFDARLSASSRVAGSAGRSRGSISLPGGCPTARIYSARLISSWPCEAIRDKPGRSEEHTSELQSHLNLVCRLLLEKKKQNKDTV